MVFGGTFREMLYVATLPHSCFDIVKDLEDSMTQGMVRSSFKTTQLTGGLFQSFVGFKEERPVRFALQQLVNGTTTMKEFRGKGKSLKSGHGKGIPDVIGGALKRNADKHIKYGNDVTSAKAFVDLMENSSTQCFLMEESSITDMQCFLQKQQLKQLLVL
ncbi:unnamed protein product [Mytilus edulis]|uniref:Uncharacterized protein n=1 Tax=Mytilus edulis TaxID=6550 RepID=A0A8S3RMY2_MYTED|nr:unnamed protein product [Mytilus edulis]